MSKDLKREMWAGVLALLVSAYAVWDPLPMNLGRWELVAVFFFGARFGLAVQRVQSESEAELKASGVQTK